MAAIDFPFVEEFITDNSGQVKKVILDFEQYQRLMEMIEDKGLYSAMLETIHETPLTSDEALQLLEAE